MSQIDTILTLPSPLKILSIQSHVTHGYVGNKAATFPLQFRGWDVDALNTVQFSNHPGHGRFTGPKASADDIQQLARGLQVLDVPYAALLTGYVPDAASLAAVGAVCAALCRRHGSVWVVDPVLGDNGKLYVSREVIPVYQTILRSGHVTLATPNQFEIETLVGREISSLVHVAQAMRLFHEMYGVPHVVVTSIHIPGENLIYSSGSSRAPDGTITAFYYRIPLIDSVFSGSGDLLLALLTDAFYRQPGASLAEALGESLSVVENVLLVSQRAEREKLGSGRHVKDLRLIEARGLLKGKCRYTPVEFNE
ncbi:hypothetical protein BABINDRAFT_31334 [Babjeviella inositovora NRRL Y-12698]|uniref:pyridoxal kinase n=1 Tax=Babjeviella inositovora NRRL Y-12698 TaxID=984486 RepID=A0A1E3QXA3_9ASCO|nr:uncharacterized protein BABINDRAFT_31334 [Babjeviella inositovora NRRL Y-12698]ODQ82221.1 hypothetical protein BABINDRAFT_31334 [Babjeviella inositovora NRRL Y-12698]